MKLQEIQTLQSYLRKVGYHIAADGVMGPETKAAIRAFQTKYFATGEPDKATIELLTKIATAEPVPIPSIEQLAKPIFLPTSEFIVEKTPKNCITLHLTAGSPSPHFTQNTWASDTLKWQCSVGTQFIIAGDFHFPQNEAFNAKSGEIYQAIPLEYWAYHVNWNKAANASNIGIEICNRGPLINTPQGFLVPNTSLIIAPEEVEEIDFRGFKYWHRITDAQIEGLRTLILALMEQYPEIKRAVKAQTFDARWADYNPTIAAGGQKGIFTHTNFIPQEQNLRFDMPPFPRLLEMLKSLQ